MSKRKIEVVLWETVTYTRSAIVETNLNDSGFGSLLDKAEQCEHPEDVELILENEGVKIIESFDNDYSSPSNAELEIIEYIEVEK